MSMNTKNHVNSAEKYQSLVVFSQPHLNHMSKLSLATSTDKYPKKFLALGRLTKPLVLVSLAIIPSLVLLLMPSCNEVSLHIKFWGFDYQLVRKESCNTQPDLSSQKSYLK